MPATYAAHMTSDQPARVRWLGHASVMIELAGVRVLTDPALTPRLAHLRRHHRVDVGHAGTTRPGADLARPHGPPPRALAAPVRRRRGMIVPAGAAAFLRRSGFGQVRETRPPATPPLRTAHHRDRAGGPQRATRAAQPRPADAVGYVLRGAGDPACTSPATPTCSTRWATLGAIDVALRTDLGLGPRPSARATSTPSGRHAAVELVRPQLVVPIHWGTYSPVVRRGAAGVARTTRSTVHRRAAPRGRADRLRVLSPGSAVVPRRCPTPIDRT